MKIEIELDNLTKEEQETVKQLAEKKKEPYWVPKKGETYFLIDEFGFVSTEHNNGTNGDGFAISLGNCFRTREEAEEAITRFKMQTKWKRLSLEAGEADNPWNGKRGHYCVRYPTSCSEIRVDCIYGGRYGIVTFPSENSLKAAIKELGEENVKKYILGVTE